MKFYPLKFNPIFHYRIWGGEQLKTSLNKEYDQESIGESWEISAVPDSETVVSNGVYAGATINNLIERFKEDFLGKSVYEKYNGEFPLLIKFIDAKKPLSIQVHPNNELARERHDSFGKN
ncbi:MAG: type I phosphomannose isomerase catalytic subunit, partial [Nonlabens sp.]